MSEFATNINTLDLEALKALLPPMKQDGFVVRGADVLELGAGCGVAGFLCGAFRQDYA